MKKLFAAIGMLTIAALAVWWGRSASLPATARNRPTAVQTATNPRPDSKPTAPLATKAAPSGAAAGQVEPARSSPPPVATVFGKHDATELADLPAGRFREELVALAPAAQTRALAEFVRLQMPLADLDSVHADASGKLFYACTLAPNNPPGSNAPLSEQQTPSNVAGAELGLSSGTRSRAATLADFSVSVPVATPPVRHSKPGSSKVIYLDFNGHTVTGTSWNTTSGAAAAYVCIPFDKDGNTSSFSPAEQSSIVNIWARVAEDYRTFDVDVTTEEPASYTNQTSHVLITRGTDANGVVNPSSATASGVAYVGVFGQSNYASSFAICFVYHNTYSDGFVASVASHETGHNMGLHHDGTQNPDGSKKDEYYGGHGSGPTSWSPIMGSGSGNLNQWSKGEYYQANQFEDDLAIIEGKLSLRADDHTNTDGTATALIANGAAVQQRGIITNVADTDRFLFTTDAGPVALMITANTYPFNQNSVALDLVAELYNSSGSLVASSDPPDTTSATINATLAAGTYYLRIHNTGIGTPLANPPSGYTSYGSIGEYVISGTITPTATNVAAAIVQNPANDSEFPGNSATFSVIARGNPATSYRWQRSTDAGGSWQNLADDTTHSGSTSAALTIANIAAPLNGESPYRYRCFVDNGVGSATSTAAILTVQTPPPPILPAFVGAGIPVPTFGRGLPAGTSQNLTFTLSAGSDPITFQWRLNGVDIPGANGLYYFVRNWQAADAGVYTVVATNPLGSVTSNPYTQYISPEGGWQWRNSLPSNNGLTRAAFLNGRFLVGGLRGTLLGSTDGFNWTTRTVPASNNLYSFHYVNGLYVALGSLGAVFTSPDTIIWTPRNTGTLHQDSSSGLQNVAYSGSRLMAVGIGGIITTSTDGINWTPGSIGTGDDLNGVAYAFGRFHAVSATNGKIYSSVDGAVWTSVASSANSLRAIVFGNDRLVAVGSSGAVSTSTDGLNWTSASSGTSVSLIGVDYVNGQFIAAGTNGTIRTSPNGLAWSAGNTNGNDANLQNTAFGNGVYVTPGQSGTVTGRSLLISTDGINWSETITGVGAVAKSLRGIAAGGGSIVAVGTGETVLQSSNGSSWNLRTPIPLTSSQLNDVNYGGGRFIAVGNSGTAVTSTDGNSWTSITIANVTLNGVKYDNSLWIAVGASGSSGRIYSSSTGTSGWTSRYSGGSALNKSDYGNGVYVAVGDAGTIVTSANGTNWSAASSGTASDLTDVTFGGGLHVAVGAGVVLTSPDGTTWTNRTFTPDALTSVIYVNGWFIATGAGTVGPGSTYYVSSDGINWTGRFTGAYDPVLDLALFNNQVFAVGDNSGILSAGIPIVSKSASLAATAGVPVKLAASVTASPVPVTYQWQRNGAPIVGANSNTLTLAHPLVADAGNYTLVATNVFGSVTSSATTLTVSPSAQTITFADPGDVPFSPTPLTLSATATSGLPVSFSYVSGPANLNGSSLTLTGTGIVTVRVSQGGDANFNAAPDVIRSFNVLPNFLSWQLAHFSGDERADQNISGPNAIYGTDGLTNLVKYALGLEPKTDATTGLPVVSATESEWVYTYTRPSSITDVTYAVEVSTDLATWTTTGVTLEPVSSANSVDTWRARFLLSSAAKIFFRLKVTQTVVP